MILGEYLYVDAPAVRGVMAHLDADILEEEASTTSKTKKSIGGVSGAVDSRLMVIRRRLRGPGRCALDGVGGERGDG